MKPWTLLSESLTPEGQPLTLHRRNGIYLIRVRGQDLMGSRDHGSEEDMAKVARTPRRPGAEVMVGGLGMGFTARAVLNELRADGKVLVVELSETVVEWNRHLLGGLADKPLEDPRLTLQIADVYDVIAQNPGRFDSILLDVDNGPIAMTQWANRDLYTINGLKYARRALRPGGSLVVWSVHGSASFERRMELAGFAVEVYKVRPRDRYGGPRHTLFVGRTPPPGYVRPPKVNLD